MAVNDKDLENRVHAFCSNRHRVWYTALHRKDAPCSSSLIQKHELIALVPVMKTRTRFLISNCLKSSRVETSKPAEET